MLPWLTKVDLTAMARGIFLVKNNYVWFVSHTKLSFDFRRPGIYKMILVDYFLLTDFDSQTYYFIVQYGKEQRWQAAKELSIVFHWK